MAYLVNDLMTDLSFCLLETVVNTTLGTNVTPGLSTVVPASMVGIYPQALLIIGAGASAEIITVLTVTSNTFSAVFTLHHPPTDVVYGATFPGTVTAPLPGAIGFEQQLFSQQEIISYINDVQSDLLLRVRPMYNIALLSLTTGITSYPAPADCIRVERVSINGYQLYNTSVADQDLNDTSWESNTAVVPTAWYQELDAATANNIPTIGFTPPPGVNLTAELWYSQNYVVPYGMLDPVFGPPSFFPAIKYGVLERCFSKDGEQRDPVRAQFCNKFYAFWIYLGMQFMKSSATALSEMQDTNFSPLLLMGQQAAS